MPKFKIGDVVRLRSDAKRNPGFVANPLVIIAVNEGHFSAKRMDGEVLSEYEKAKGGGGQIMKNFISKCFERDALLTAAYRIKQNAKKKKA